MKALGTLQKQFLAVLALMMVFSLALFSVFGFIRKVQRNETAIANQTLLTAADNGEALIQTIFTSYSANLKNIAVLYEKNEDLIASDALAMLQQIAENSGYGRLAVDYPDGSTYTSDGYVFDMSDFGYLDKIKRGESFITDVLSAKADGENVISFMTPLHNKEGEPIASLRLTMKTTAMTEVIDLTLFNSEGYYHLVDGNGNYVAAGESGNALLMEQNFFDAISNMEYEQGSSSEDIQSSFTTGKSGFARYSVDGSKRCAYYQPVGINNWVLMTIVPQEIIAKAEQQNISFAIIMTIQLSSILTVIFVYIYMVQRKARITAVLNDKCFRALAEQTSKVIFEWDFKSGKMMAMNNFKELFGREMVTQNSAEEALNDKMIHPDDKWEFRHVFEHVQSGKNVESTRFRVKHTNGEYHWCELSSIVVSDHANRPYKAIGSLEDIHQLVTSEARMKHELETDQLTGIYNKTITEQRIKSFLAGGAQQSALMIIDIDNFKSVNDSMGHQFGDHVLVDFAEILKSFSTPNNVIGRIGGDEFFLFFGNYKEEMDIHKNAEQICRLFAKTYSKENLLCNVSASIGISFFPRDGVDFETLYKRADIALYRTKEMGKNSYTVYEADQGNDVSARTEIDNPAMEPDSFV